LRFDFCGRRNIEHLASSSAASGDPACDATQFFQFLGGIAHSSAAGEAIHLSTALFQAIAANDVADALAAVRSVAGAPSGATAPHRDEIGDRQAFGDVKGHSSWRKLPTFSKTITPRGNRLKG